MKLQRRFVGGKLNQDVDERLLPETDYTLAQNIRILTPEGSNSGNVNNILGTLEINDLGLSGNPVCIGYALDRYNEKVYLFIKTDTTSLISEYDIANDVSDTVLSDTGTVLNFDEDYRVQAVVINDNDNGRNFLVWTDNLNEPRMVDIDYAKNTISPSPPTEEQITLIRPNPTYPPEVAGGTLAEEEEQNPFSDVFLSFSYRYRYLNGQYSAMSPFSEVAFWAPNIGTYNLFNIVLTNTVKDIDVTFNTGSAEVEYVELLFKNTSSNTVYVYRSFEKDAQGWSNNSDVTVNVADYSTAIALPESQTLRLYDNVPTRALSLELLDNRIIFGNYTEGYDLDINPNNQAEYSVDYVSTAPTASGDFLKSVKTNLSYDVAIAYMDGLGRITTPIKSSTSTVTIPNSQTANINNLEVTISHQAPTWATNYIFYIKQDRVNYYNLSGTRKYESVSGGVYTYYVHLIEKDLDKVSVGDYIYIKDDSTGALDDPLRVRVKEIEEQAANFLGGSELEGVYLAFDTYTDLVPSGTLASAGFYIETEGQKVDDDIYYEIPYVYDITNRNHLGDGVSDTNQSYSATDAVINLKFYNTFATDNGTLLEMSSILDSPTKPQYKPFGRASSVIENYREVTRPASLTYSGVYEPTTGYNAVNEFNLSEANYKDMDLKYGSIQKIYSKDTNIYVFQEDKTHRVLYSKDVLYNADASGNVREIDEVLGSAVAYTGEYGISTNPESFAIYGNRIYHLDKNRGALLRLSVDGYEEISRYGMFNYFRGISQDSGQTLYPGVYDPYNDEYLIGINDSGEQTTLGFSEAIKGFTSFYSFRPDYMFALNNRLYSIQGVSVWLHDSDSVSRNSLYGVVSPSKIHTVFNEAPSDRKVANSFSIEGKLSWDVVLKAYEFDDASPRQFTIDEDTFVSKEGVWTAQVKRDNSTSHIYSSGASYGLGEIQAINSNVITLSAWNNSIRIGDNLYNSAGAFVATITGLDKSNLEVTLSSVAGLSINDFVVGRASSQTSTGAPIRGYVIKAELEKGASNSPDLHAINLDVVKSYR